MIRYGGVLAFVLLLAICPGQVAAAEPAGPRIAALLDGPTGRDTHSEEGYEYDSTLSTIGPGGEVPEVVVRDPAGGQPSWSADGRLLALAAIARGGVKVAIADTERETLRIYPRAQHEGESVITPDGRAVVFARARLVEVLPGRESYLFKSAIWRVGLDSGRVRRVTPWQMQTGIEPSSFSPDGSTLAAGVSGPDGDRAVAIDLRSGRFTPLVVGASEPTYSPDGTRLAFVRLDPGLRSLPEPNRPVSELLIGKADGSGARRLVRRRGFISGLSWDPSGRRLIFTHDKPGFTGSPESERGNRLLAINADGSCLSTVFFHPRARVGGAAWQPGPGRGAGPISC